MTKFKEGDIVVIKTYYLTKDIHPSKEDLEMYKRDIGRILKITNIRDTTGIYKYEMDEELTYYLCDKDMRHATKEEAKVYNRIQLEKAI